MEVRRVIQMAALLTATLPDLALSDVYECDGKWTNKPCDGTVTRRLDEGKGDTGSVDPNAGLKQTFFEQLRIKSIEAQKRYNVGVDLSSAEHACISRALDLEGCRAALKAADTELEAKIAQASGSDKTKRGVDPVAVRNK